jgi:ABC-type phosphate transport system substrate-binding protein
MQDEIQGEPMLLLGRNKTAGVGLGAALAGAMLLALMFAGLAASKASAYDCGGGEILGEGASLQGVAQREVWIPGFHNAGVCGPGGPKVEYRAEGSGAGLNAWGFTDGTFDPSRSYAASDDAPTAAQIAEAENAAPGEGKILVIPVVQTAISVAVNPPVNCEIEEITNRDLERVFRGQITKWAQIGTAVGEGCKGEAGAITRVVRKDGSGTTYQFKNYMFKINKLPLECTDNGEGKQVTWQELEPNSANGKPNITWPEGGVGGCTKSQATKIVRSTSNGGGAQILKLDETNGGIAYAALPDAEGKKNGEVSLLKVQNNGLGTGEATTAYPATEGNNANCANAKYSVPAAAQTTGSGESVDWSAVFGANLTAGGENYPLCTITFDFSLTDMGAAGIAEAQTRTVIAYLREYVVGPAGQTDAGAGKFYAPLPTNVPPKHDVLAASQYAASKIK